MINNKFIVSWIPYIPTIWWCQIYPVMSRSRSPSYQTNRKHKHIAAQFIRGKGCSFKIWIIWYTVYSRGVMSTSRQHHIWSCSPVSSQCLQWSGSRRGKIQWWYLVNSACFCGPWCLANHLPYYVMWHMTLRFWYLKYLDVIEQLEWLWQW